MGLGVLLGSWHGWVFREWGIQAVTWKEGMEKFRALEKSFCYLLFENRSKLGNS